MDVHPYLWVFPKNGGTPISHPKIIIFSRSLPILGNPYLRQTNSLTNIFQMGWFNHQLENEVMDKSYEHPNKNLGPWDPGIVCIPPWGSLEQSRQKFVTRHCSLLFYI